MRQRRADQRQFDGGVTTVYDQHDEALRYPTPHLPYHHHQNINRRFVLTRRRTGRHLFHLRARVGFAAGLLLTQLFTLPSPFGTPDFGGLSCLSRAAQDGQKRQRPHAPAPRQLNQQHQTEPFQAETFHDVFLARTHRIAITTDALDAPAAPSFNGIVRADDDGAGCGYEPPQQTEQNPTGLPGAPPRAVEDAMVVLKMFLFAQTDRAQTGRDRTRPACQQCAQPQNFRVFPDRLGKERVENYHQTQQLGRQCVPRADSSWWSFLTECTPPALIISKTKNG